MKKIIKTYGIAALGLVIVSCSVKKDKLVNRTYHKLTTKFNVLHNGKEALKGALKNAEPEGVNYDERINLLPEETKIVFNKQANEPKDALEVEKVALKDNLFFGSKNIGKGNNNSTTSSGGFKKAEQKATKAINKHSMWIRNTEKNKQIDKAYFLLGESKYYQGKFYEALESFEFIASNFKKSKLKTKSKIWAAKCQVKIGNNFLAQEILYDLYKKSKDEKKSVKEDISINYTNALLMDNKPKLAIETLDLAIENSKSKKKKLAYKYLQAQLFNEIGEKQKAIDIFEDIKSKSGDETMRFKAEMAIFNAFEKNEIQYKKATGKLKEMLASKKYKAFYSELNYYLAEVHRKQEKIDLAFKSYQETIEEDENLSPRFKGRSYFRIGDIHYQKSAYILSAKYLDSALKVLPKEDFHYEEITEKSNSLKEVLAYSKLIYKNDSILRISNLSEEDRKVYFEKYIENLKKEEENLKKEEARKLKEFTSELKEEDLKFSLDSEKASSFYFYNYNVRSKGKKQFQKKWGDRQLTDNWRVSALANQVSEVEEPKEEAIVKEDKKYDIEAYLQAVVTDPEALVKLKEERDDAQLNLGILYYDKLFDVNKSTQTLEEFIETNPDKLEQKLVSYYNLYKMNKEENVSLSNKYKKLLMEYPSSKYALFVQNEGSYLGDLQESTEESLLYYEKTYQEYKLGNNIGTRINHAKGSFNKQKISLKFALLEAFNVGRFQSKEEMDNLLILLEKNYPTTEEGKKAKEILETKTTNK